MALDGCLCDGGTSNVGVVNCPSIIKKSVGIILVPKYDSTGAPNRININTSTAIDPTTYTQNVDPLARWYPLLDLKDVNITREDTQYRTFRDGSKEKTREGIYSYESMYAGKGAPAGLIDSLNNLSCVDFAFYIVAIDGKLVGNINGNFLEPIGLEAFDPYYMFATDEAGSGIMVRFDFDNNFEAGKLYQLNQSNFTSSILDLTGVYDAILTEVATTTTSVEVKVTNKYGEGFLKQNVAGLTDADFTVYNETTGLPVTILTVTENPNVSYEITFAAQTSADELTVATVISTSNYEGEITVTVP